MALWQIGYALAVYAVAVLVPCLLVVRIVRRERRMVSGMLAATRANRADAKQFADRAEAAAKKCGAELPPFTWE